MKTGGLFGNQRWRLWCKRWE